MTRALLLLAILLPVGCGRLAEPAADNELADANAVTGPTQSDGASSELDAGARRGDAGLCAAVLPPDGSVDACSLEQAAPGPWLEDAGSTVARAWEGGYSFARSADFLGYVRELAVAVGYIDPSRQIDCTSLPTCDYDPRSPRSGAWDIHDSDDRNRFVGPDGHEYVWGYDPGRNIWFLGDAEGSPAAYCVVLQCNEASLATQHDP